MHHSISFSCLISIYCTLTRSYEDFVLAHGPGLSLLNDRHTTGTNNRSLRKYISNRDIQIVNRYETNIHPLVIWETKLAVATLLLGRPLWKRERDMWARTWSLSLHNRRMSPCNVITEKSMEVLKTTDTTAIHLLPTLHLSIYTQRVSARALVLIVALFVRADLWNQLVSTNR